MEIIDNIINELTSTEVTTMSAIGKLFVSLLLGGAVGFERKLKGQSAGLRTFALISMGATLAMLISIYVPQEYMGLKNGDPGRIAAQVVTGVGFLGAGAIIQMKGSVRGLTTAAGIWMVATIGMAVGLGMYAVALSATLLILVVLHSFERWEHKSELVVNSRTIRLTINCVVTNLESYREVMRKNKGNVTGMYLEYDYELAVTRLNFVVLFKESADFVRIFEELRALNPTQSITLSNQISI